jgi:hypothetical protein
MIKVIMVALVGGAFVLSWYASDVRRLTRDFGSSALFSGALIEALIRFPLAEYRAYCSVGANSQGLYIAPSPASLNKGKWWHPAYHIIKSPLFIPWTALEPHAVSMPFGAQLRFDVPSLRVGLSAVCFFMPLKDAEPLLASAGRHVSPPVR